ncbi:hypothetical protein K9M79_06765 [Candidatus Woesearchaeota archaeon]|nr:hypothetical protein [Candidatus Woesearchaeota archaeon]
MKHITMLVLAVLCIHLAFAESASLTESTSLYFTGTSSDPGTLYQDAVDGNNDVGLSICGLGTQYVGLTYAIKVDDSWLYSLVSYSSNNLALAYAETDIGSNCYAVIPGYLTVSPSKLTTPDPDVYKAAFPGKMYVAYSLSANPGDLTNFVFTGQNATLLGDILSERMFDQEDRTVTISTPEVSYQTSSGIFSKDADNTEYGISADKQMVIGICSDEEGADCSDGVLKTDTIFPIFLSSGLSAAQINDQMTHTKYVVSNGIASPFCVGANLKPQFDAISPNPVYYSQNLYINFSVLNPLDEPYETKGGNVDVSTNFRVLVNITNSSQNGSSVYDGEFTINDDVISDGYVQKAIEWPAYARSGTYNIRITVDSRSNIAECDETDNTITTTFQLLPITTPHIYIDGEETSSFPKANIPYNVSLFLENSDNITLPQAQVNLVEINGLSLTAPSQIYNRSTSNTTYIKDGIITENRIRFTTDYQGQNSFTYIPTVNKLYAPEYDYLEYIDYLGNFSHYIEGEDQYNESFMFVVGGTLTDKYYLGVSEPFNSQAEDRKILQHESAVSQVLDYIYRSLVNYWETTY